MRKLTAEICEARGDALDEAAEHLLLEWTDDQTQQEAGVWVSLKLTGMAADWYIKAERMRKRK